VSLKALAAFTG